MSFWGVAGFLNLTVSRFARQLVIGKEGCRLYNWGSGTTLSHCSSNEIHTLTYDEHTSSTSGYTECPKSFRTCYSQNICTCYSQSNKP